MSKRKGGGGGKGRPFKKTKYFKGGKELKDFNSISGILFTCHQQREREAKLEALSLVEEYEEEIFEEQGPSKPIYSYATATSSAEKPPEDSTTTTTTATASETTAQTKPAEEKPTNIHEQLKAELKEATENRLFDTIETGCKGYIFVQFKAKRIDPVLVCARIMKSFMENPQDVKSRYLYRMFPAQTISHASQENIVRVSQPYINYVFDKYPFPAIKTYKVILKSVNNTSFKTHDCSKEVAKHVPPHHFADLHKPKIAVMLTVMKTACCISVVEDYQDLMELNINALRTKFGLESGDADQSKKEKTKEATPTPAPSAAPSASTASEVSSTQSSSEEPAAKTTEEAPTEATEQTTTAPSTEIDASKQETKEKKKKKKIKVGGINLF